ncbi:MAG: NAD-dependent epimerase/dehydratase family protein [Candidatus Diapherotrites archaeon]
MGKPKKGRVPVTGHAAAGGARVLVTGGAGFIGMHLAKALALRGTADALAGRGIADGAALCGAVRGSARDELRGCEVTIADNLSRGKADAEFKELCALKNVDFINADLSVHGGTKKLGKPDAFDFVYHLAAINGTRFFYEKPEEVLRVNISSALNILEWLKSRKGNGAKIIFSSSSEAYAGGVSLGVSKIPTPETAPLVIEDVKNPRWSYGGSKIAGELLFVNYARRYGFPFSIVRYHNVYGPRMGNEHVIPEFIMRAQRGENPFKIQGGGQTRAFCFVDDAVRATIMVAESEKTVGEIVHIGNDKEEIKISELAGRVCRMLGYEPELQVVPSPEGSAMRRCPDITKLRTLTGFEPKVSLAEGLKKTAEWYLGK